VGGGFASAGGVPVNGIARWGGGTWNAVGGGVGGRIGAGDRGGVYAITVQSFPLTNIFVGGGFATAGGVTVNGIARWDGTKWYALGSGVSGSIGGDIVVNAIATAGQDVIVGGGFAYAGGVPVNGIARWDNATLSWRALGSGVSGSVGGDNGVHTIIASSTFSSDGNVIVGGGFAYAGGVPVNGIARWDGTTWHAVGCGLDGEVEALAESDSIILVGGRFSSAGGAPANYVGAVSGLALLPTESMATLSTAPGDKQTIPPSSVLFSASASIALVVGIVLVLAARRIMRVAQALRALDLFARDHFESDGNYLRTFRTPLGGALSVSLVIALLGIVINTAVSVFATETVMSSSYVPPVRFSRYPEKFELDVILVASSLFEIDCGTELVPALAGSPWTATVRQVASFPPTCEAVVRCRDCAIEDFVSFSVLMPSHITALSWAVASLGPLQGTEPQNLYFTAGNVSTAVTPTQWIATVSLSLTVDARTSQSQNSTGVFASLDSQVVAYTPSNNGVAFNFRSSGLVFWTQVATRNTAVVEAVSLLLGAATGMIAFFRWILGVVEQSAVWWGDASLIPRPSPSTPQDREGEQVRDWTPNPVPQASQLSGEPKL
jgi:hypothetical protein